MSWEAPELMLCDLENAKLVIHHSHSIELLVTREMSKNLTTFHINHPLCCKLTYKHICQDQAPETCLRCWVEHIATLYHIMYIYNFVVFDKRWLFIPYLGSSLAQWCAGWLSIACWDEGPVGLCTSRLMFNLNVIWGTWRPTPRGSVCVKLTSTWKPEPNVIFIACQWTYCCCWSVY